MLVAGVSKFRQYLIGGKFIIKTDNNTLTSIFGSKKGMSVMAGKTVCRDGRSILPILILRFSVFRVKKMDAQMFCRDYV